MLGAGPVHILCLNRGSSTLKFSLYALSAGEESLRWSDIVEQVPDEFAAVQSVFSAVEQRRLPAPNAVGHRVVHGGPRHGAPQRVTPELLTLLRELIPLAPLHLPSQIETIEAVRALHPALAQVVCFDTAFHRSMPEIAQRLPLPRIVGEHVVRRYGFHGLSYEYVVSVLGDEANGRVIVAHLGNGASMAAIRSGRAVDTTMGFTPAGGLMMGTRPGDLDPGIILYLLNQKGFDGRQVEHLIEQASGLLGVSGLSADMKTLLAERASNEQANQAIGLYCYLARKHLGSLMAALGGLDTLVFTGGIGEHAAAVRSEICRGLELLGLELDAQRNERNESIISSPSSRCTVRVIATREDLVIARHVRTLLAF